MNEDLKYGQTTEDVAPATPAAKGYKQFLKIPGSGKSKSFLFHCLCIAFIVLILLIPLSYVQDVVYDRAHLFNEATRDIAESWGGSQTISGPALIIPYVVWEDVTRVNTSYVDGKEYKQEVTKRVYTRKHKVLLPENLTFDSGMEPEIRYRGIYQQALFTAPVQINGNFVLPEGGESFAQNLQRIDWSDAWLAVGVTDLKAIGEAFPAIWNNTTLPAYKPGTNAGKLLGSGFHITTPLTAADAGKSQSFSMGLQIRGSGGIAFTPVGEKTTINIQSAWSAPKFRGNLLPAERHITPEGFSATWQISNLTRTYPQMSDLDSETFSAKYSSDYSAITSFSAGVDMFESVSLYRMILRAVNYGVLFITVTFIALFSFEMFTKQRLHTVQYTMVGLSMSLFYLILLSLAEHITFGTAFFAASAVTVGMNSLYVASALKSLRLGLVMTGLLSGLYALLLSLLRMEDFALLVGTGLVVVMMGVLMVTTRRLRAD